MKTQKHLPIFGVGPIYVFTIAVLTFAAYRMRNLPALASGRIDVLQKPLFILGVILIVLGVFIWFQAAVVSRLLDGIVKNRLVRGSMRGSAIHSTRRSCSSAPGWSSWREISGFSSCRSFSGAS